MIKCIIFDCDGTLVDSEHLLNHALSEKLSEKGIDLSAQKLIRRFRGVKLLAALEQLEAEHSVSLNDAFIEDYRKAVEVCFSNELVACVGVEDTLTQLDLAMCVASNGPLEKMQLALSVTNLSNFFKTNLFSAYEINAWKPDPELFKHAANVMGYRPSECLVVEDSVVGIEAAYAAGMGAVLYDPKDDHAEITDVKKLMHFSEVLNHC